MGNSGSYLDSASGVRFVSVFQRYSNPNQEQGPSFSAKDHLKAMGLDPEYPSAIEAKFGAFHLPEGLSLSKFKNAESFSDSLLQFAKRLRDGGKVEAAAIIYSYLQQETSFPQKYRDEAKGELDVLLGQGSFGRQTEYLFGNSLKEMTDFKTLLPILAGGFVGEVVHLSALGRLMSASSTWLTRGVGARVMARGVGLVCDIPTYVIVQSALSSDFHFTAQGFGHAIAIEGIFRLFVGGSQFVGSGWLAHLSKESIVRKVLPSTLLFSGLLMGQQTLTALGFLPATDNYSRMFDLAAMMGSQGLASYIGKKTWGKQRQSQHQPSSHPSANK